MISLTALTVIFVSPAPTFAPISAYFPPPIPHKEAQEQAPVKAEAAPLPNVNTRKPPQYQRYIVTAYTNGYESTQRHEGEAGYGVTASGKRTQEGVTAACAADIPFGTRIYIAEIRHEFVCYDRGAAITDGHVDIYMDSLSRAKAFGRREMSVKFIAKGDG